MNTTSGTKPHISTYKKHEKHKSPIPLHPIIFLGRIMLQYMVSPFLGENDSDFEDSANEEQGINALKGKLLHLLIIKIYSFK